MATLVIYNVREIALRAGGGAAGDEGFLRTTAGKIDFSLPASFRVLEGARECRLSLSTDALSSGRGRVRARVPHRQKGTDFFTPSRFTRFR